MAGLPAHSMAWQQRMRNRPGPLAVVEGALGGSGEQPTGGPMVELYIGGWIDITALGLVRYEQGIHITRGQDNEAATLSPASCTMTLDNRDGRFSPRNPNGPWYGQFGRNTPIRVSVQSGNAKSYRFWGEVPAWPQSWDQSGTDVTTAIEAAGVLRRFGQGSSPLRSPVYLLMVFGLGGYSGLSLGKVAAYWPCEDGARATQIASGIGGGAMQITGSPDLASYSDIASSDPLPVLNNAVFKATVPNYTPDPTWGSTMAFMLAIPSAGETAQTICQITTSGTLPLWEVYYTTASGGGIGLRAKDSGGTIRYDSGNFITGVNGKKATIGLDMWDDPVNGAQSMAYFLDLDAEAINDAVGSTATYTIGRITSITFDPAAGLANTAVGHVAVLSATVNGFFDLQTAYEGYNGEAAGGRFQRLCNIAGVANELIGVTDQPVQPVSMGPQHSGTLTDLFQEVADTDGGILYELTTALGLGYRTHNALYNQPVTLALDYAQNHLADVPVPLDDDTLTQNDVTVQRLNGSFAQAQQLTGPLNVQNPPAGVGRYDTSITINIEDDSTLNNQASWRLHVGTVDEARYPTLGVQLAHPTFTQSTMLRGAALAVRPGDRITVANPPSWLPPDTISQLTIGFDEQFDQFTHHIQWNCRPESPWRVGVLDDVVLGRADTNGSTIVQAITGALNANPTLDGSIAGWSATNATVVPVGDGTGLPMPSGATPSFGALVASDGSGLGYRAQQLAAQFPVVPGQSYNISALVYSPNGTTAGKLGCNWTDAGQVFLSTSEMNFTLAAGTWTAINTVQTAPANAAFAYARIGQGGAPAATDSMYFAVVVVWRGTLQVATTTPGSPLWTTSAAEFPFDVIAGGERMTVTGISGSTSPQTFTVTRSVNGVVKAQNASTDVRLYQPMILAL